MKNLLFLVLLLSVYTLHAQQTADRFSDNQSEQKRDPRLDQMNFVPNEVIVKFKDEAPVKSGAALKTAGISNVDQILKANGVDSLVQLFPNLKSGMLRSSGTPRIVKDPQGQDMVIPNLDKIYLIKIPQLRSTNAPPINLFQLIDELKNQSEVEYAEPNYIYSIDYLEPVGEILTAEEVKKSQELLRSFETAVTPNDPLYSQQWYIPAIKADLVWNQTTGDSTQVIAILDTGTDWTHPDLKNKIWTNPDEIPDNGIDDDENGFIDDIRGWDYINNDNNPMDDNSHGTHVAGIAAAEANNGIGIAGVNWYAKILPIKVFQSSGRGDVGTISRGIVYAAEKGATVINMSFGSYARSLAMEDALANAYATTILVAAAGNDAVYVETCFPSAPFFPAALSYVLGVESPDGSFSNRDCNGPTFSNHPELLNYEMKAPGTNVISTIPNGNYRVYQGTSMAAPAVSAALSLYRNLISYEEETNEFMWVKLIQSTKQYLDIFEALTIVPKPEIWFLNKVMVDTLGTSDKDGRVDAGETIQMWFRARNTGGQVDSVYWKIRLSEFEDTTTCEIIKPTSYLGSISPYATRTSESDPMMLKISPNVAHDRDITFDLLSWYKGATDTLIQKFVFTPENGEELFGVLETEKVLYPDKLYLINQSFKVGTEGVLIIKPGTKILFYPDKTVPVNGRLIAEGKPDSLIYFEGYSPPYNEGLIQTLFGFRNSTRFNYCHFSNIGGFMMNGNASIFNSIINVGALGIVDALVNNYCRFPGQGYGNTGVIYGFTYAYKNNLIGPSTSSSYYYGNTFQHVSGSANFKYNNIFHYAISDQSQWNDPTLQNSWISEYSKPSQEWNNGFYRDVTRIYQKYSTYYMNTNDFQDVKYQYWGTSDSAKIEGFIFDFMERATYPRAKFQPFLNAPPDSCHCIVWKVLVNGKDAQDEVVEPVGVGKQRFDVYFNRPMDTTATPQVAFGVRYPFSSNAVNEEDQWSEDGRIYTVYKTVKLTTGDGINRIRVVGAKDLEGWEIPTEDMRFEFLISAAGSSSLEFMATPGLGKVDLEWNNNDLEDGLGYNMYRMEHINDSTLTEPVIINSSLITDTLFTDYNVVPNKKYYYYYKILRTNFAETDSSRVVSSIPFTASKGDANGDLSVNVLDITTIVAHLLQNNPQPFIFEAADYNSDLSVNVLDIVGVVNHVLYGDLRSATSTEDQVSLYLRNDTLFADASTDIGGLQLEIAGISSMDHLKVLPALEGFESGYNQLDSAHIRLIYYSLSGKVIPAGRRIPLLLISEGEVESAIAGDKTGKNIPMSLTAPSVGNSNKGRTLLEAGQNYPNPAGDETLIPVILHQDMDQACLRIYDLQGIEVNTIRLPDASAGSYEIEWRAEGRKGVFIYRLEASKANEQFVCPVRKMVVL